MGKRGRRAAARSCSPDSNTVVVDQARGADAWRTHGKMFDGREGLRRITTPLEALLHDRGSAFDDRGTVQDANRIDSRERLFNQRVG